MIEEVSLRGSRFKDISIKEMHTIDVIGKFPEATPSKVSKELMVTLGTVTTSLNNLERKGYIERIRSDQDRSSGLSAFDKERSFGSPPS